MIYYVAIGSWTETMSKNKSFFLFRLLISGICHDMTTESWLTHRVTFHIDLGLPMGLTLTKGTLAGWCRQGLSSWNAPSWNPIAMPWESLSDPVGEKGHVQKPWRLTLRDKRIYREKYPWYLSWDPRQMKPLGDPCQHDIEQKWPCQSQNHQKYMLSS